MPSLARASVTPSIVASTLTSSPCTPRDSGSAHSPRGGPAAPHRRLAASLALALTVSGQAGAGTVTVTRCNDQDGISYFGKSLRLAISVALDGDTVDLSGLACSTITLERGELYVDKGLTLVGPSDHLLTIDANSASRVINNVSAETLQIQYLGLTHGLAAEGGCIASAGIVQTYDARITGCASTGSGGAIRAPRIEAVSTSISGNSAGGKGGGIYSPAGYVALFDCLVSNNTAGSSGGGIHGSVVKSLFSTVSGNHSAASGGGIIAGDARVYSSIVAANSADVVGGAIRAQQLRIEQSTISGNVAYEMGGFYAQQIYAAASTIESNTGEASGGAGWADSGTIINSTISGNGSPCVGGLISRGSLDIRNSTIAFNTTTTGGPNCPGGILGHTTQIISSIVARNTRTGGGADDVQIIEVNYDPGSLTASTSLIMSSNKASASLTSDPLLAPLAHHGGGMRTHALLPGSPAIDAGSNPNSLTFDARGSGFARNANGSVDIGAYERQVNDDERFANGFD